MAAPRRVLVFVPLAAAALLLPSSLAHVDGGPMGTPKLYCEPVAFDTGVHEYGVLGFSNQRGWIGAGTHAAGVHVSTDSQHVRVVSLYASDGSVDDCDGDSIYGDFDGHYEFAVGGAWLLACDPPVSEPSCGAGVLIPNAQVGSGAAACWGTFADHLQFPHVEITDVVLTLQLGVPVPSFVGADFWNNLPGDVLDFNCGDFETDYWIECLGGCTAPFPAGLDGSYAIYVDHYRGAVQGHIEAS